MLLSASNVHIDSACIRVWQSALPPTSNLHTRMINALPCPSIARVSSEMHVNDYRENRERENMLGNVVGAKKKKKRGDTREPGSFGSLWNLGQETCRLPFSPPSSQMPGSDADARSSLFSSNCYRFDVSGPVSGSYITVYMSQAYRETWHFINILVLNLIFYMKLLFMSTTLSLNINHVSIILSE